MWLQCRLKFYFRYVAQVQKPPTPSMHAGSTVHAILQNWNLSRWRRQPFEIERFKQRAHGVPHRIVIVDGDVQNSTRAEYFAKAFPERSFQVGIAESNLVGVGAGLAACIDSLLRLGPRVARDATGKLVPRSGGTLLA